MADTDMVASEFSRVPHKVVCSSPIALGWVICMAMQSSKPYPKGDGLIHGPPNQLGTTGMHKKEDFQEVSFVVLYALLDKTYCHCSIGILC